MYYHKDWEVSLVYWYNNYQFLLIQQITVTFFSYSVRDYNAISLEIWVKDNMWQKILGEILKRLFVTVEIYRLPDWYVFRNVLNGLEIKISWVENFQKINKQGGGGWRLLETWEYSNSKVILLLNSCDLCLPITVAKCFLHSIRKN